MKIKLSQFKKLITEMVLQEIDLKSVNPNLIGAYAFVLAYNEGLAQGLFPRNQKLNIEFAGRNVFSNGTLFVNPYVGIRKDEFYAGAGHDLLHSLTQNGQMHFSSFKKGAEVPSSTTSSKNNETKAKLRTILRAFKIIKEKFGLDLFSQFPDIKTKPVEKSYAEIMKFLSNYNGPDGYQIRNLLSISNSNYYDHGHIDSKNPNPPTHAIEEIIGNFINDGITIQVFSGVEITKQTVEEILAQIENWNDNKDFYNQFKFYDRKENNSIIEKWKNYVNRILPSFALLYNEKLNRLKRTKFGYNSFQKVIK